MKNNSIIEILRSIKDISDIFDISNTLKLNEYLTYGIYIRHLSHFNHNIENYHISFGHNENTSLIQIVIKRTHILIDKDKNIFIHIAGIPNGWTSFHLYKDEIYNDDIELCLKHGRILFEDI